MQVLRSYEESHRVDGDIDIWLDLTKRRKIVIEMIYVFIVAWLNEHCNDRWSIEWLEGSISNKKTHGQYLRVSFENPSDAILFKLSPYQLYNNY